MNLRHSYKFFQSLVDQGRIDLALVNAAIDGRIRLALHYAKQDTLDTRSAWYVIHHWMRYNGSELQV